jgi:hypothetical protein
VQAAKKSATNKFAIQEVTTSSPLTLVQDIHANIITPNSQGYKKREEFSDAISTDLLPLSIRCKINTAAEISAVTTSDDGMSKETSENHEDDIFCAFITKNVNLVDDATLGHQYCAPSSAYDGKFCAFIDKHVHFVDNAGVDPFSYEEEKNDFDRLDKYG